MCLGHRPVDDYWQLPHSSFRSLSQGAAIVAAETSVNAESNISRMKTDAKSTHRKTRKEDWFSRLSLEIGKLVGI